MIPRQPLWPPLNQLLTILVLRRCARGAGRHRVMCGRHRRRSVRWTRKPREVILARTSMTPSPWSDVRKTMPFRSTPVGLGRACSHTPRAHSGIRALQRGQRDLGLVSERLLRPSQQRASGPRLSGGDHADHLPPGRSSVPELRLLYSDQAASTAQPRFQVSFTYYS